MTALPVSKALLLIGHGSVRYPNASDPMERHAATLRAGPWFGSVHVAVLNGTPTVHDALAAITATAIRVVPFFMEDGYFTRVAIPRTLEAQAGADGTTRQIILCPPVGVHDGLAGIMEHQALAACDKRGLPSHTVAVVIIGHGSASAPGRTLALHRHAARIASTTLFARVEAACLEEPPFVADTLAALRAHPVVVIGFFANQGGHVRDDVPALIAAERTARGKHGPDVVFHGCAVDEPAVVQIILDQATSQTPA